MFSSCCERSNRFIEDMYVETIKCHVSFSVNVRHFFMAFSVQVYQHRKFWFILAFLCKSTNG